MALDVVTEFSSTNDCLQLKVSSILSDRKNANLIIDLLKTLLSENQEDISVAVVCLQQVFNEYLEKDEFCYLKNTSPHSSDEQEPQKQYQLWLLQQYNETKSELINLLCNENRKVQESSGSALHSFLCREYENVVDKSSYPNDFLRQIVSQLLSEEHDTRQAIKAFTSISFPNVIKLHILNAVYLILKKQRKESGNSTFLLNVYALIQYNWIKEKSTPNKGGKGHKIDVKAIRVGYSQVWIEFLKNQIPFQIYKRVLVDLHEDVLPNMKNPLVLTDFLTESYNYGGAVSLLALNGLFYLIQNYNLEYPNFFTKLYALLTEDIFQAKYRPRFFYLLDLFLSSTHLPAYLVAAFSKKMSRLSLVAPPDVLLIILPFVRNLLVRHPSLKILINRSEIAEVSADPYLAGDCDPSLCKAMDSSLWEIKTLQCHWHPLVSKEARFVDKSLPSMEKDLADIFETKYSELFHKEIETNLKEVPLSYDVPKGLFNRTEDKMHNLWRF